MGSQHGTESVEETLASGFVTGLAKIVFLLVPSSVEKQLCRELSPTQEESCTVKVRWLTSSPCDRVGQKGLRGYQIKWGTREDNLPQSWGNIGVRDHLSFSMYFWRSPDMKSHEGDEEEREERRKTRR